MIKFSNPETRTVFAVNSYGDFSKLMFDTARGQEKVNKDEANDKIKEVMSQVLGVDETSNRRELRKAIRRHKIDIYEVIEETVVNLLVSGWGDNPFFNENVEIKSMDMSAILVAENIASQLEKRISFRRAVKQAVGRTMRAGAKGIKVAVSGRLGGAEIARSESYREGSIPLQTLRANIDYGVTTAHTTFGAIGVRVWIYKGELAPGEMVPENENTRDSKSRGNNQRDNNNRRGGRRGERRERKPRNQERSDS